MNNFTTGNESFNEENEENFNNEQEDFDFGDEFQLEFNDTLAKSLEDQHNMIGKTLAHLNKTTSSMKKMHSSMKKMHSGMQKISTKTELTHQRTEYAIEKVEALNKKLDDRILLSDSEISEIFDVIRNLSIKIGASIDWQKIYPKAENFGQVCGWIRITLWSILSGRFGVSSYKKIRYVDFDKALEFARTMTPYHYFNRKGYYKK